MCLFYQSGGEEEKAPEPEREYTPAGRALKTKLYVLFFKLRELNLDMIREYGYVISTFVYLWLLSPGFF